MCPDRQLLSVYADQELPSPWREKLEVHLSECPSCAARTNQYKGFSSALRYTSGGDTENAKGRVWKALHRVIGSTSPSLSIAPRPRRGITLPIPAAVAAILVVALAAAFVGGPLLTTGRRDQIMASIGTDVPEIIPDTDMASILRYLETQDLNADLVIIRLPETRSFVSFGEPTLIRAADYTGRIGP